MITYSFDNNIFNIIFSGKIFLDEIIQFIKEFGTIEDLPRELYVLYDLRKADLRIDPNEIKLLSQTAEDSTKTYKSIKSALLVIDPKNTAYSTLFSNKSEEKRTQRKIFSTMDAAMKWLLK